MTQAKHADILIVDDQVANLAMLSELLDREGLKVRTVTSGERALAAARLAPPDCMLLDVAMPGLDGYRVCELFQADEVLRTVPIIFLTAYDDPEAKVRGFALGARDFVTKPCQAEEVLARVHNQLQIRQLEAQLRASNDALSDANLKLREASEIKATVTATLVHDIRNPLMVIGAVLAGELDPETLQDARAAFDRVNALLQEMLDLAKDEFHEGSQRRESIDLNGMLETVGRFGSRVAEANGIVLHMRPHATPLKVCCNPSELERVFANLVGNAVKFTPRGGHIELELRLEHGSGVETGLVFATVRIRDTGPGIAPDDLPFIFDSYRQGHDAAKRGGIGLGLAIAARIVARHKGRIHVRSRQGVGSEFEVWLPLDVNCDEGPNTSLTRA